MIPNHKLERAFEQQFQCPDEIIGTNRQYTIQLYDIKWLDRLQELYQFAAENRVSKIEIFNGQTKILKMQIK